MDDDNLQYIVEINSINNQPTISISNIIHLNAFK